MTPQAKPAAESLPLPPQSSISPPSVAPPAIVPEPMVPAMPETARLPPAPITQNAPEPVRIPAPIPSEGAALRARFGNPDFVRREMDSELWRYDGQRCAVFFFMQRAGQMLRLRYTETLPRGMNDMVADPACLEKLEQRTQSTPAGVMNPAGP